jgi:hypothetical protein
MSVADSARRIEDFTSGSGGKIKKNHGQRTRNIKRSQFATSQKDSAGSGLVSPKYAEKMRGNMFAMAPMEFVEHIRNQVDVPRFLKLKGLNINDPSHRE